MRGAVRSDADELEVLFVPCVCVCDLFLFYNA